MSTSLSFGQANSSSSSEKYAVEILFNPFKADPFSLINGVRGYYAWSDKINIRCDFGFDYKSATDHEFDDDNKESTIKNRTINFSLYPGIQYNIIKADKFSVYVGSAIGFEVLSAKTKLKGDGYEIKVSGASNVDIDLINGVNYDRATRSSRSFGLQAFAGVDYSLYKSLYIGAELGLSFKHSWQPDVDVTIDKTTETDKDYTSSSDLGFFIVPAFRLGWRF